MTIVEDRINTDAVYSDYQKSSQTLGSNPLAKFTDLGLVKFHVISSAVIARKFLDLSRSITHSRHRTTAV